MPFSFKTKKLRFIFIVFWVLLLYIIAALVWWFIALNNLNHQMTSFKLSQLAKDMPGYVETAATILDLEKRKKAQYIGEGAVFLLLIIAGAVFIFRAVQKQFKQNLQQQHLMMAITHELKTPIAITKLNLETLLKRKLDETKQQQLLQNTIAETNRLNDLCSNLLLASQIEAGKYQISRENINLSGLVQKCSDDFAARFASKKIISNISDDVFIDGDSLSLQLVLSNLIDNAIKYSPKDSTITVSLAADAKKTMLSVKDEGRGIDAEEKKKIFEKYYRVGNKATKESKGTGLGLFLTKKIIQQHNAVIFVQDNKPTGSIFSIEFGVKQ